MGTNYQGQARPPAGQNSPEPSPSSAPPTILRPADADSLAAAARSTPQYQGLVDDLAWIKGSTKFCPFILPVSASSGFSVVTTASGWTGTVTPSGTVKVATGHNLVILITLGGAVATAKFKTSLDGGVTYGSEQTTAASMTCATSGITLAFSGTFTLNGTAQFHSAMTPALALTDLGGIVREFYSRNGFRASRVNERTEDWTCSPTVNPIASGHTLTGTPFLVQVNGTVGIQPIGASSGSAGGGVNNAWDGVALQTILGTTNANCFSIGTDVQAQIAPAPTNAASVYVAELNWSWMMANVGANNQIVVAGFVSPGGALPAGDGVYFRKASANTNWQCVLRAGGVDTATDSGIAPTANVGQRFKIELHSRSSPLGTFAGAAVALFFIDDKPVAGVSTGMPAVLPGYSFGVANSAGLGGAQNHWIGPPRYVMSQYGTLTPI